MKDESDIKMSLPSEWQLFLITCFVCAFVLATHDRFVSHAKQPLHFTRGFIWMPLCLLALPFLQKQLQSWVERRPRLRTRPALVAVALLVVACFDNSVFVSRTVHNFAVGEWDVQTLRPSQRDVLEWMDVKRLQGTLASTDSLVGYLSATYTSVNPFVGHKFNTPNHADRKARMTRWLDGKADARFEAMIDYVLVNQSRYDAGLFGNKWTQAYANDEYVLLTKSRMVAEK